MMPTRNRRDYIAAKTRVEFRDNLHEKDAERIKMLLVLGETNLDDVMAQAEHLTTLSKMQGMHHI